MLVDTEGKRNTAAPSTVITIWNESAVSGGRTVDRPLRALVKRLLAFFVLATGLPGVMCSVALAIDFDSRTFNGFNLNRASVPVEQIHAGGPPRDGIPSIDEPRFIDPDDANFLVPGDRVLGLAHNGVAKAYPIKILNWHEIVNDEFRGESVVVSYCPLCGTGMAFSAKVDGKDLVFGVSGLLHNSDLLLYDRYSLSLWSQIMREAVSGTYVGTRLEQLPASHTTWRDWRERHPDTLVLSRETGFKRDYSRVPYEGYEKSGRIYFPVPISDERFHPKEKVIGLTLADSAKVYPFAELSKLDAPFTDEVAGRKVTVYFDAGNRTGRIVDAEGNEIPSVIAFWFAWVAFYPDTIVYRAP